MKSKAFICPIIVGIIMLTIGFCIKLPGGVLTTRSSLDGRSAKNSYYTFDNRYSAIDEYVGGDAYNYEIGASLVAGKLAGILVSKTIYIVAGMMCICMGITLFMIQNSSIGQVNEAKKIKRADTTDSVITSKENEEKIEDSNKENVTTTDREELLGEEEQPIKVEE